ncbi:MAG: acetate--CoA ligase family protein, partial [Thermoplasmata archaeon]|nr:acetate--CoA ligase family protein [Thermoplasmata archaeon]
MPTSMKGKPDISLLYEPHGIAIIGASQKEGKIGHTLVQNLIHSGYEGGIYPVNPRGGEFQGLHIYKSLGEVEGQVDLACIVIPSDGVFQAVKDCAKKGLRFLIIITSGFSEIGNIAEEKKIVRYAHAHGMRVLGPNVFGIFSAGVSMNATFGPKDVYPGNVAIITQSGAIGGAIIGKAGAENIGLASIASVGNKSDVNEADLLRYLIDNEDTRMILMYIEGIRKGGELVGLLKEATRKKPVVVIKAGRSKKGALAAASHTGSLAGSDKVFDDIMRQCGVIRAESIQEALEWCKFLSCSPLPRGENAVIITNGGGVGVLAADACEKYGVKLYDDIHILDKCFSKAVPAFGSAKNPVDLTGQASAEDYDLAMEAAFADPNIHSIICLECETGMFDMDKFTRVVKTYYRKYQGEKPMVFSLFGGRKSDVAIADLNEVGVSVFSNVFQAVSCLGVLYCHYRNLKRERERVETCSLDHRTIEEVVRGARNDDRQFLLAHEARDVMAAAGIPTPQSLTAHNMDEAVRYAEEIGYPVVLKIVSKDIIHKSDAGGIALDIGNKTEVIDAYESIMYNCRRHDPNAHITGVEVMEMVVQGIETIIGARRDASFGPIVMFGLGGIYVEVMKDVAFRA